MIFIRIDIDRVKNGDRNMNLKLENFLDSYFGEVFLKCNTLESFYQCVSICRNFRKQFSFKIFLSIKKRSQFVIWRDLLLNRLKKVSQKF